MIINILIITRNEPLSELSTLEFNQLTICYDLLRKKFDSSFRITSFVGNSNVKLAKLNGCTTPTPKQENICAELKLFNKAYSENKTLLSGINENETSTNFYSNHLNKVTSESVLSINI